jgi:hypothetical protein
VGQRGGAAHSGGAPEPRLNVLAAAATCRLTHHGDAGYRAIALTTLVGSQMSWWITRPNTRRKDQCSPRAGLGEVIFDENRPGRGRFAVQPRASFNRIQAHLPRQVSAKSVPIEAKSMAISRPPSASRWLRSSPNGCQSLPPGASRSERLRVADSARLLGVPDSDVVRPPLAELLAPVRVSTEQAQALVRLASARLDTAGVLLRTAEDTRSAAQAIRDLIKYFRKSTWGLVKTPF